VTRLLRFSSAIALLAVASTSNAQVARRGLPGGRGDTTTAQPQRVATGTIDGFVGDTSLAPLQAAEVKILSTNVRVNTGPNGRFRISTVPVGQYVLIVRRAGYSPTSVVVQVAASDTLRLSYTLERAATTLAAATVTAPRMSTRMADFDRRRRAGLGEFLTGEEIDKRAAVYATDLMRRFRSINVSPSSQKVVGGAPEQYALSKREGGSFNSAPGGGGGYCAMTVLVDDVRMPTPFNLDMLPSPRLLGAIEVYAGPATVPPQWSGYDTTCGVIAVWTKDGY
jgi:hypothetical protein